MAGRQEAAPGRSGGRYAARSAGRWACHSGRVIPLTDSLQTPGDKSVLACDAMPDQKEPLLPFLNLPLPGMLAHGSLRWLPSPLARCHRTGRKGVWMCILGKRQQEREEKETTFQKSN